MIDYTLIRSSRRTLSIQIDRTGALIARAPMRMSVTQIEHFIMVKKDWIEKHKQKAEGRKQKVGEKKQYTEVEIIEMKKKLRHYIVPRVQELWEWRWLPPITSIQITKSEWRWGSCSGKNWLCFSYRLAEWLSPPPEKGESEGVTQRGVHNSVTLPNPPLSGREFIDAIIIHELAHLREKNHQRPFWDLVYSMMPEYESIMKNRENLD
jgi:predicted metal-dependent hydrolase